MHQENPRVGYQIGALESRPTAAAVDVSPPDSV
jgi:hypothetical protein